MTNGDFQGVFDRVVFRGSFLALATMLLCVSFGCLGCGGGSSDAGDTLGAQLTEALAIPDPYNRTLALIRLAREQQKSKDTKGVQSTLASAKLACEEIDDDLGKAEALASLAVAQVELGSETAAEDSVKEVRRLLDAISEPDPQSVVRIRAKLARVKAGNPQSVAYEIGEAETVVESIPGSADRALSLLLLARTCHDMELNEEATRLVGRAREVADTAEEPKDQAEALAGIALTYSRWSDTAQADAVFEEAEQVANSIEGSWERAYAQIHIAEALESAGRDDEATQMVNTAEETAKEVRDTQLREQLFGRINKLRR